MKPTPPPSRIRRESDRRASLALPDQIPQRPDFSALIGREPIKRSDPPSPGSWRLADLALLGVCALFFALLFLPHIVVGWTS